MKARSDAEFQRIDPRPPGSRTGATARGAGTMVREQQAFQLCMKQRGYEWSERKDQKVEKDQKVQKDQNDSK